MITTGPNDIEFKEALYAWPEPIPLEFGSDDGARDRVLLNGVGRTDNPTEWKFFAVRIAEDGEVLGRSAGRYSPESQTGFITDYDEFPGATTQ
jgi:hypothetical protein